MVILLHGKKAIQEATAGSAAQYSPPRQQLPPTHLMLRGAQGVEQELPHARAVPAVDQAQRVQRAALCTAVRQRQIFVVQ